MNKCFYRSFSQRAPCDRLGDLGPSVINLITSIYSTWFVLPGKGDNSRANLLYDAHKEEKKRNSPHAKTAGPSKAFVKGLVSSLMPDVYI